MLKISPPCLNGRGRVALVSSSACRKTCSLRHQHFLHHSTNCSCRLRRASPSQTLGRSLVAGPDRIRYGTAHPQVVEFCGGGLHERCVVLWACKSWLWGSSGYRDEGIGCRCRGPCLHMTSIKTYTQLRIHCGNRQWISGH